MEMQIIKMLKISFLVVMIYDINASVFASEVVQYISILAKTSAKLDRPNIKDRA